MKDICNILFQEGTDNLWIQFFRYIFVGGTAFIIDFSIYSILVLNGLHYLISAIIAFIISVLANYLLSTKWVFNQSSNFNKKLEFNLFIIISTMGLGFTEILLYIFTDSLMINLIISKIIVAIIVLFWNFAARRVIFYWKK